MSAASSSGQIRTAVAAGAAGLAAAVLAVSWYTCSRNKRRSASRASAVDLSGLDMDGGVRAEFMAAAAWVGSDAAASLPTSTKLALYGCYKQATGGDCLPERPRGMEASYKWDAWHEHRGREPSEAARLYVATLDALVPGWRSGIAAAPSAPSGPRVADGSMTMGPTVSTLGQINDPDGVMEVDATPVGQLCEKISEGEDLVACSILRLNPALAFQADKAGMTPLHWAADRGSVTVVQALLALAGNGPEAVARLNAQDDSGDTALHYAVLTDNREVARLLVSQRADVGVSNHEGESPLELATAEGWGDALLSAAQ